ncbi:hypothetical protein BGX27_011223 [Mortierella sp. AM989]|nr:hypothetical protein BGX27_011223 [Mortierella sp. AM989]
MVLSIQFESNGQDASAEEGVEREVRESEVLDQQTDMQGSNLKQGNMENTKIILRRTARRTSISRSASPRSITRGQVVSQSDQTLLVLAQIDKTPRGVLDKDPRFDILDGSSLSDCDQYSDDSSNVDISRRATSRSIRKGKGRKVTTARQPPPRPALRTPSLRCSSRRQNLNTNMPLTLRTRPYLPTSFSSESSIRVTTLLQPPSRPVVTQEDKIWAEAVMRFDPELSRFRYVISDPLKTLSDTSRLILDEAYNANKMKIGGLREEDYEFFGVIAETTSDLARSYFTEQIGGKPGSIAKKTVAISNNLAKVSKPSKKSTAVKYVNHVTKPAFIVRQSIPPAHHIIQKQRCVTDKSIIEFCRHCVARKAQHLCIFQGFRCFHDSSLNHSKYESGPDFLSDPREDEGFRFYKVDLGIEESNYIIAYIHSLSQELFKAEAKHVSDSMSSDSEGMDEDEGVSRDTYVRRPSQDRQYCEMCKASIVSGYWMCCVCGQDFCQDCFETLCEESICTKQRQHHKEQFVPCGRFHLPTLIQSINSLNTKVQGLPKQLVDTVGRSTFEPAKASKQSRAMDYREPLESDSVSITLEKFRAGWCRGEVILLTGVGKHLKKDWSPKYLKSHYGAVTVRSVDVKSLLYEDMTLKSFFEKHFIGCVTDSAKRMMEWPSEPFQEVLEDLFTDLLQALPLPDYTRLRGVFNLVRYFPIAQIGIDLSPKLYPSQGLGPNCQDYGSIPISCEMSDSIYICVYTNPTKQESKNSSLQLSDNPTPAVIWDVYRAEDRHLVQEYIEQNVMSKKKSARITDAFTFHTFYLSPSDQSSLFQKTGVRPYQVMQNLGDAIMIPAGCARQARYIHDSILVGLDFVSPERLGVTLQWHKELRKLNLRRKSKKMPDVLMTKNILFYSTLAAL